MRRKPSVSDQPRSRESHVGFTTPLKAANDGLQVRCRKHGLSGDPKIRITIPDKSCDSVTEWTCVGNILCHWRKICQTSAYTSLSYF